MSFQEAVAVKRYVSSAILFENTKKDWRGESQSGTGFVKSVRIRTYNRRGEYDEPVTFDANHPDFQEMVRVARSASLGMSFMEEEITEENLEMFSRSVLSNPYCKNPMEEIRRAIKLADSRKTL